MAKNKLHNLLNFSQFEIEGMGSKQKKTKRTDTGLDVILEHHIEDADERKEFIIDNIDKLDDEWIEIIYLEIEKGLDDQGDDVLLDDEGDIVDDEVIDDEVIDDEVIDDEVIDDDDDEIIDDDDDELLSIKKIDEFEEEDVEEED